MSAGFSLNAGVSRISMSTLGFASNQYPKGSASIPFSSCDAFSLHLVIFRLQCLSCHGISLYRFRLHFVATLILMNWLHKTLRQHTLSPVINTQIYSFPLHLRHLELCPCAPDEPAASGEIVLQTSALSWLSWQMQFECTWQNSQQKH